MAFNFPHVGIAVIQGNGFEWETGMQGKEVSPILTAVITIKGPLPHTIKMNTNNMTAIQEFPV